MTPGFADAWHLLRGSLRASIDKIVEAEIKEPSSKSELETMAKLYNLFIGVTVPVAGDHS